MALEKLKLKDFLKNPYLFRSQGLEKASDLIENIMIAYQSSSDETLFGDAFFEPIAKRFAKGSFGLSEGVDMGIETKSKYTAYALKSGPNWGNAGQLKKQNQDFMSLRSRLKQKGHFDKEFDAVIGHAYGNKNNNPEKTIYRNISGQVFWEEITGDKDFHIKLIKHIKVAATKHREEYLKKWDHAVNKFTLEFGEDFCHKSDGSIDWEKFVRYVSDPKKPKDK
jgi:hypothetical protein